MRSLKSSSTDDRPYLKKTHLKKGNMARFQNLAQDTGFAEQLINCAPLGANLN
jgi:hypothetical protein